MIPDPFPTEGVDFYRGRRVVVTGATGLIGSYVVKLLKESGAWVRAIVYRREPNEFTKLADEIRAHDLSGAYEVDRAVRDSGIVLSCAVITGGIGIVATDPLSYVGPATAITINTLHAAAQAGCARFGYLSSTTVYPASEKPVVEGDELAGKPYSLYRGIGESKRFLEKLCSYYHEKAAIACAVVRPSGAYGRFDSFHEGTSHVIPGMVNRALRTLAHEPFEVWGDGEDVRDFVHAQDVAMGLLLAVKTVSDASQFNIASGVGITTRVLAEHVLHAVGRESRIVTNPQKPSALKVRLVSIEKARTLLGYRPTISLEAGLRDVVNWRASL